MDFQFQLLLWAVILVIAVVVGGPVLAIFAMFVAWLLPFVVLGGLALVALVVFCAPSTRSEPNSVGARPTQRSSGGRPTMNAMRVRLPWRNRPRTRTCPRCGDRAIPIGYGFPGHDKIHAAERSELHIGGCMPKGWRWHCKGCEAEF